MSRGFFARKVQLQKVAAVRMVSKRQESNDFESVNDGILLYDPKSRRKWIQSTLTTASFVALSSSAAHAEDVLPSTLRDYTKLAPLGPKTNNNSQDNKSTGLAPTEVARRLSRDLVEGAHGKGGYFLSGDLSPDLFLDDCVFEDPTNRVNSLSQYQKALSLLFDPERSTVELLGDGLSVNNVAGSITTITGRLRSRGYLKVAPWNPYVKAYETSIAYTLDSATGLIARQDQQWTKGASEALWETFTPSREAPKSLLGQPEREPKAITKLFDRLNGRRPNEYSAEERIEIDQQIDKIVAMEAKAATSQEESTLAGTWALVYLQPGPEGAGIDRRLPFFPEFDFNDSFQVFSSSAASSSSADKVTNIGQVLGSLADVRVSGSLVELESRSSKRRRFEANIEGGKLCLNSSLPSQGAANCPVDLPMIQGKGIFDSLYLGDRLRIGQNINGGGARVVQVRLY